jgi:hypothetical protein
VNIAPGEWWHFHSSSIDEKCTWFNIFSKLSLSSPSHSKRSRLHLKSHFQFGPSHLPTSRTRLSFCSDIVIFTKGSPDGIFTIHFFSFFIT